MEEIKKILLVMGLTDEEVEKKYTEIVNLADMKTFENFFMLIPVEKRETFDLAFSKCSKAEDFISLGKEYNLTSDQFVECKNKAYKETMENLIKGFLDGLTPDQKAEIANRAIQVHP